VELPGTQKENELFIESNRGCSRIMLDLSIPNINLMIPSKDFLESLYNRICYDVLLWQSRASKDENLNEGTSSDSKVPLKLDLESQIFYKNHTESNNSKQTPKFYSLAKDSDESDEEDQATTIFNNNQLATNAIALNLSIDEGRLSIFSSLNHEQSKDYRRIDLFLRNAVIFYVSAFHDDPLLDYMCCRLQSFSIHHQSSSSIPDHVIEKDEVAMVTPILCADDQSSSSKDVYHHNMLSLSLRICTESDLLKRCLIAVTLHGFTYHHIFENSNDAWFDHLVNFASLRDEASQVAGYIPPVVLTETHLHIRNSSLQYRPKNLDFVDHTIFKISSFWLSSNIYAESRYSNLHFYVENARLHLSDSRQKPPGRKPNSTLVIRIECFEVIFNLLIDPLASPKCPSHDLCINNLRVNIETCSDSCLALLGLIQHLAASGNDESREEPSQQPMIVREAAGSGSLAAELKTAIEDGVKIKSAPKRRMYESFRGPQDLPSPTADDEFCIIDDVTALETNEGPQIRYFNKDSDMETYIDYFKPVSGRCDRLQPPEHLPTPECTYQVREMTCVWSFYGGRDSIGGISQRDSDILLELHINKCRLRHDVFSETEQHISRTALLVEEVEMVDKLTSSTINKFFYRLHDDSTSRLPRHGPILLLKMLQSRSDVTTSPECRVRVSLQPLRLNIDQDSLYFITCFLADLQRSDDVTDAVETDDDVTSEAAPPSGEIFFKELVFTPEVPVRIDYHGKRVVRVEQGTVAGLLMGLGQLNNSQITLRRIHYRRGLSGLDRLLGYVVREWAADIKQNQLPSILSGVGPMNSVVKLAQGIKDLLWLPIEQYRQDGRIIRGVRRGTASFGSSTAMATLEMSNKFICMIQKAAENMNEIVLPYEQQQQRVGWRALAAHANHHRQPISFREGLGDATIIVQDGVHEAASSLARAACKQHEQKGFVGAVGGVLRHMPSTVVAPVIIASKATSKVICGMRNQIRPDAKEEDECKWKAHKQRE